MFHCVPTVESTEFVQCYQGMGFPTSSFEEKTSRNRALPEYCFSSSSPGIGIIHEDEAPDGVGVESSVLKCWMTRGVKILKPRNEPPSPTGVVHYMDVRGEHVGGGMVRSVYFDFFFVCSRGTGIVIRCDRRYVVSPTWDVGKVIAFDIVVIVDSSGG